MYIKNYNVIAFKSWIQKSTVYIVESTGNSSTDCKPEFVTDKNGCFLTIQKKWFFFYIVNIDNDTNGEHMTWYVNVCMHFSRAGCVKIFIILMGSHIHLWSLSVYHGTLWVETDHDLVRFIYMLNLIVTLCRYCFIPLYYSVCRWDEALSTKIARWLMVSIVNASSLVLSTSS